MKIVMIGSGNVATHISLALQHTENNVVQVYSKTLENASILASKLNCIATNSISELCNDADIYIFSIKDDVLLTLPSQISEIITNKSALFIHTAGSVPMNVFQGTMPHYGVLYPMQTFSKTRSIDFHTVPCFIEGSSEEALETIRTLALSITEKIKVTSSEKRKMMHLAAVFACNLANHCYRLAEKIVEKEDIDFCLFLPLIEETAKKVTQLSPKDAQTGPMVRNDISVMNKQLDLIENDRTKQIYRLMAESIYDDLKK